MRKYLILFTIASFIAFAETAKFERNPFTLLSKHFCQQQEHQLLQQLQKWQFVGLIKWQNQTVPQFWLKSANEWLMFSQKQMGKSLLPWEIKAFDDKSIQWAVTMTPDCQKELVWTMSLELNNKVLNNNEIIKK